MRRLSRRYSRSDASVSIDMAHSDGNTSRGVKAVGPGLEVGGHVALGVDLAHQGAPAVLGGVQRQRGGHRGLADAALAGDEEEAPVEEPDHAGARPVLTGRNWPRAIGVRGRRNRPGARGSGAPTST